MPEVMARAEAEDLGTRLRTHRSHRMTAAGFHIAVGSRPWG